MDCENDTCEKEKRGCEGCFYYKLNKAIDEKLNESDELFKEVGFERKIFTDVVGNDTIYSYERKNKYDTDCIDFMLKYKTIIFDNTSENPIEFKPNEINLIAKAIDKKCQELGWKNETIN